MSDNINVYTLWYNYANQNLNEYNRLAFKYNLPRLISPLNINH